MWHVLMDTLSILHPQARKLYFRKPAPFSPPLGVGLRGSWPRGNRCPPGPSLGSRPTPPPVVSPIPAAEPLWVKGRREVGSQGAL